MSTNRQAWVRKHPVATALLAVLVTSVAVGAFLVQQQTVGYWERLAAAKSEFERANGLTPAPEQREGSAVCLITCGAGGEATITARYPFRPSSSKEVAQEVARLVATAFGEPAPAGFGDVLPKTPLPSVGSGAYAEAEAFCPDNVAESPSCTLRVRFVSGIE